MRLYGGWYGARIVVLASAWTMALVVKGAKETPWEILATLEAVLRQELLKDGFHALAAPASAGPGFDVSHGPIERGVAQ